MNKDFNVNEHLDRLSMILGQIADSRGVERCVLILEAIQEVETLRSGLQESEKKTVLEIAKLTEELNAAREERQNGDRSEEDH